MSPPPTRILSAASAGRDHLAKALPMASKTERRHIELAMRLLVILPGTLTTLRFIAMNKGADPRMTARNRLASIAKAVRV